MKKWYIVGIVVVVGIAALCVGWYWYVQKSFISLQITSFDIGQGDATLIKFRNGENMLIDCGPDKKILHKLGSSLRFKQTLDYLVITHFDLDHYGGCIDVLKRYEVKHIFTNGQKKDDVVWREWNKVFEDEHAETRVVEGRFQMVIASTTLDFLAPLSVARMREHKMTSNNFSIITRLSDESSGKSILFTGDIEELGEKLLLQTYCSELVSSTLPCAVLQARVLKVGHHGSDTSSSQEFLQAVRPETAVISVGKSNSFGHPSRRILKRLERSGATILRTDEKGDILYPK
jgi:competence protein ComEC